MTTGINWTDMTGGVRGCSRMCASGTRQSGCGDPTGGGCYAERMAWRIVNMDRARGVPEGEGKYDGLVRMTPKGPRWTGVVRFDFDFLAKMIARRKPARVFPSMGDPFHESLSNHEIAAAFGLMAAAPQHTFQVLTKRADRARQWFAWMEEQRAIDGDPWVTIMREAISVRAGDDVEELARCGDFDVPHPWPLPNVWLGVSVENQAAAEERVPALLRCPAAIRFLSCEPLLGPVDLDRPRCDVCERVADSLADDDATPWCRDHENECSYGHWLGVDERQIRWVIVGCESGGGARPCDVEWIRSIVKQCDDAGVPVWLKQAVEQLAPLRDDGSHEDAAPYAIGFGAGSKRKPGGVIDLPYLDGRQWAQMPEDDDDGE